jgi:cytochrome c-type biogenesis protein CcsB
VLASVASWTVYRSAATDSITVSVPIEYRAPAFVGRVASLSSRAALVLLTASIVTRAAAVDRPPIGNLWEYTTALGWGITLFSSAFELKFHERAVSAVMMTVAVGLMTVALVFFPSTVHPLVPALQANRILAIHVTSMVLAYSSLSISFGAACLYLLRGRSPSGWLSRLPERESLDEIGYWSVLVGFPLLTLGIALGAYWASSAWGRYWGWDPKETAALLTWFVYAGYLHARVLRGWEGNRSAWLLVLGFGAILFTYFAVNFVFAGLHSYAGV